MPGSGSGSDGVGFGGFAVRPPTGEALSLYAAEREEGAGRIVVTELDAVGIAEIEFGEIAVKVRCGDVLIGAIDAALQD